MNTNKNDFKYILNDLTTLSFGARYSYQELLEMPDTGFKFKTIIRRYLTENVSTDCTLESHLYYMKRNDPACEAYVELRARVMVLVPVMHGNGRIFLEKVFKIAELADIPPQEKERMGMIVRELRIPKTGLMRFTV